MNESKIEQIIYNLSKKSDGKSQKLFEFFGVSDSEIEAIFPVTKFQRDIIIDVLMDQDALTYNICMYFEVSHKIDINIWNSIIEEYAKRNFPQRTRILIKDSLFYQAVYKRDFLSYTYLDVSSENFTLEKIQSYFKDQNQKSYDITKDILCRNYLLKIAEDKYCIGFAAHQIILDGFCGGLIFQDLLNKYESIELGNETDFINSRPFKEYIFFNNENFDSDSTLDFWKEKSKGLKPIYSNIIKKETEIQKIIQSQIINTDELKQIKKYCWNKKITIPLFFKSIYCLLIKYYFQTEDNFVIYENFNSRGKEYANSLGEFLYVQPNIIDNEILNISGNLNLLFDYLRMQRKETRNYHISMSSFMEFNKNQKIIPFFNYFIIPDLIFFNQNVRSNNIDNSGKNELYLYLRERNDYIELFNFYSDHNFDDHNFLNRFCSIVRQIVSEEKNNFFDFQYILDSEKKTILDEINSNKKEILNSELFPVLFEKQVIKTPDKIAIQFEDKYLTYHFLNKKVDYLAELLTNKHSIQKQEIVGVFMERSELFLIAFLGIMKSGAIYVPIDTKYPDSRISHIIKESCLKTIISDKRNSPHLALFDIDIILIEDIINSLDKLSSKINISIQQNDIAYIIFTSGSTGKPKGVIIEHIGMLNHLNAKINDLEINGHCIIAQNASQSFDISIWQFLTALIIGGKTIIYSDDLIFEAVDFFKKIDIDCVNILEVVPSYLSVALEVLETKKEKGQFKCLKYLLVTGETVHQKLIQKWFSHFDNTKVVNAYGPTEASDDITHFIMDHAPDTVSVPIGKPVQNMDIYILDGAGRLCPPGIKGEICVAGIGVGRGYLNDVYKTELAFKRDNFGNKNNRLYKTGDLGYYTNDGVIMFLGRKDYQVKIRGHRIELGEIEEQLNQINGISKAIVVDIDNDAGEKNIGAFVILEKECTLDPDDIKNILKRVLPEYMLPAFIKIMDEFPLTINQKIDRKVLSISNKGKYVNDIAYIPPINDIEKRIVKIWADVLDIDIHKIGRKQDFFLIGGHSLTAIKAVQKLKEIIPNITINSIFTHSTIEQLAKVYTEKLNLGKVATSERFNHFHEIEEKIATQFSAESHFIRYLLPTKIIIILFINNPEMVTNKSFIEFIELKLDDAYQPHYILNIEYMPINNQNKEITIDEITIDDNEFFEFIKMSSFKI